MHAFKSGQKRFESNRLVSLNQWHTLYKVALENMLKGEKCHLNILLFGADVISEVVNSRGQDDDAAWAARGLQCDGNHDLLKCKKMIE